MPKYEHNNRKAWNFLQENFFLLALCIFSIIQFFYFLISPLNLNLELYKQSNIM